MNDQIQFSDIKLLSKIFVADSCHITLFDPYKKVAGDNRCNTAGRDSSESVFFNFDQIGDNKLLMDITDFNYIFDFTNRFKKTQYKSIKLDYITNQDGSIRWIYGPGKASEVLCFYNASNPRSKFIELLLKTSEKTGMGAWIRSGSFTVYYKNELRFSNILKNEKANNFSVFTGTAGQNRTAVLAALHNKQVKSFSKLPLNAVSKFYIEQEVSSTLQMQTVSLFTMDTPQVKPLSENGFYTFSNIKTATSVRTSVFTELHAKALEELFYQSVQSISLLESKFMETINNNLQELLLTRPKHHTGVIIRLLDLLKNNLDIYPGETIPVSIAHGDFTPWNMYRDGDKLKVYDWEMMHQEAPALIDLFHFHFQKGILIERKSVSKIQEEIYEAIEQEPVSSIIKTHCIEVEKHLKLYLMHTISSNLILFSKQKELSQQHIWLLQAWEEILRQFVNVSAVEHQRTRFINVLNQELANHPHAFLKFNAESLDQLDYSSDLDIAIRKEDINKIVDFSQSHILVKKAKIVKKSFMTTLELFFKDGSFLSIDLINQFKRKNIEMMDIRPLLTSANYNTKGVMVPEIRFDLEYCLLFYTLNNSTIPAKYEDFYSKASVPEKQATINYLNQKYGLDYHAFEELFVSKPNLKTALYKSIKEFPTYSFFKNIRNSLFYIQDTFISIFKSSGFIITFTGVDGVGKSTVINLVKDQIESNFRKEVILKRHRPGILPILSAIKHGKNKAEEIASNTIPRQGENRSLLSSVVRFSYYYLDYLFGQVYIFLAYTLRGKIVLYDRYYFDFINDSKRSNIQLNKGIVKWLYRFIFKPKLNIFLYADPQEVYKRKQELDPVTIEELTMGYQDLFNEMAQKYSGSYKSLENKKLDNTISFILKEYTSVA